MSQKRHLDLLRFVFPKGKGCSVHSFVKKKFDFDKIQGLPTNGGLTTLPPTPCHFFAYTLFTGWLRPWLTFSAEQPRTH